MITELVLLAIAVGLPGDGATYPRADLLAEVKDLMTPSGTALHVLDARGKHKYLAGHLPGAVWVDHFTWSKAFANDPAAAGWANRLGELGLRADSRVVVYDDTHSKEAARIWWILRYCGLRDVRLLNGGFPAWQAANGKQVTTDGKPMPTTFAINLLADRLASKDHVLKSLQDASTQIVDARSKGEYCGEEGNEKRKGAIPRAAHLEWSDLLDAKTQRFKSREELSRLFRDAGIDLDRPAITYCQSGGRASVMTFAMELMGAKEVRNYYRSWSEWANAEDTPVVKPTPKK